MCSTPSGSPPSPVEHARILFDVRDLAFMPTAGEGRVTAEWHAALSVAYGWRIAYLTRQDAQFGLVRMVEIVSGLRGAAAAVFTNEVLALAWLNSPDFAGQTTKADHDDA